MGTFESTKRFQKEGSVCIHNFANAETSCWGRVFGQSQEEILFRQTNLSEGLTQDLYLLDHKVILTTEVTIFRGRPVDLVSSTALDNPDLFRDQMQDKDYQYIRQICS